MSEPHHPAPPQPQRPGGWPPQQQPNGRPGQRPLNTLSLVAFIGSFFGGVIGIVCGHISLSQIKKRGERGRGLALAGTIIGYVVLMLTVIGIVIALVVGGTGKSAGTAPGESDPSSPAEVEVEVLGDPSGERSDEFCHALAELYTGVPDEDGIILTHEQMDLFGQLAAVESPNQIVYTAYYDMLAKPEQETAREVTQFDDVYEEDLGECRIDGATPVPLDPEDFAGYPPKHDLETVFPEPPFALPEQVGDWKLDPETLDEAPLGPSGDYRNAEGHWLNVTIDMGFMSYRSTVEHVDEPQYVGISVCGSVDDVPRCTTATEDADIGVYGIPGTSYEDIDAFLQALIASY